MTLTPSSARGRDDGPELGLGQLGRSVDHSSRLVSRRGEHRRLRCDDLDDIGAVADDAARGGGERLGAIRLEPERVAMPPGRPDRGPGRDQPRSGHLTCSDRVAQCDLEVADRPGAARGRDAGAQGDGRVGCRGAEDLGVRAAGDRRDRALGRIEGVVRVGVDQSGKQRPPATVDDDGRRSVVGGVGRQRRAVGDDRRDPLAIDHDVDILEGDIGHAIDEPDRLEDRPHRAMLPTGDDGRG